ncbi:MAG: hypothetical protein K0R54_3711, partial [Clostridiaceae bacterium]|nr:hypothetical protein [Clostridiaceae bacterium]
AGFKTRTGSIPVFSTKYRGVEQLVARRAHNPKVIGSSPIPATIYFCGGIAQLARAFGSYPKCRRFKSYFRYHIFIIMCWSGGTGRRTGLKILRALKPVPVRFRSSAPGVEQLVARRAHNPKVIGSSPIPATICFLAE